MAANDNIDCGGSVAAPEGRREERRQAILDAAESLFLTCGYDRVSLAAVVKRSGGSLATLYELFGNKHGLLRAVIERGKQERFERLGARIPDMNSAADILRLIAADLRAYLMTPHAVGMIRIIIAESLRDPAFGRGFHEDHLKKLDGLAELFRDWNAKGKARFDDPAAAAALFHAIMTSDAQLNALIGPAESAPDTGGDQMQWRLDLFIEHFGISKGNRSDHVTD